jgi:hypothetical protein
LGLVSGRTEAIGIRLRGSQSGQATVRESPDTPLYFFSLAEPKNGGIVVTVRKHVVLWESETAAEFTLPCS